MPKKPTRKNKNDQIPKRFLNFSKLFETFKKSLKIGLKYEKGRFFTLIVLITISAILPYLQNGLFGKLIDATISYKNSGLGLQNILTIVTFLIIVTIIPNLVDLLYGFIDTTFRFSIIRQLELHFYKKISELDIATFESTEYQELQQKANERGGVIIVYQFIALLIENLENLVGVVLSFTILGFIDQTLLIYAFMGSVPALYVQLRYGKSVYWIWDLNSNNRRRYSNLRGHFMHSTTALVELKLYQLSKRFIDSIKKLLSSFDEELEIAERRKLISEFIALLVFGTFLGLGMWRIIQLTLVGQLPLGQMLFAYTTYRGFKGTLGALFRRSARMAEYGRYADYWFKIDDLKPKIESIPDAEIVSFSKNPPRIEFQNVSFRYSKSDKKFTIQNLSFTIEPGQKIAIVGLSGAGKTTLIKLLCRVYDPETGRITINGKDLREIELESWQKQVAVLFQDYVTYEFTVKEAVSMGNSENGGMVNNKKVLEATKMARADVFIDRLPKKYNQLLWKGYEDGVDLSKGENQRMALARVLYRESPITILDEPTASVDALAEQEIFETLEKLPSDRTVILISHRFSTVKNADNIMVIEHGKLIEEGNHQTLLTKGGRYAQLYKIQADSYI